MIGKLTKREDNYYLFVEGKPFGTNDDLYLQYEIVNKLSKQNCDEIFGVVDVEKLAKNDPNGYHESDYQNIFIDGFINGFNKAMELYQPTEIEVEIEMECETGCNNFIFNGNKSICCGNKRPKLDDNNNLILRRI
jgi:hypothetical protein